MEARELKAIYRAETAEPGAKRLSEFDAGLHAGQRKTRRDGQMQLPLKQPHRFFS
jgi:hypothetical protein